MKSLLIVLGFSLLSFSFPSADPLKTCHEMNTNPDVTLTILFDNYRFKEGFENSWGFSCLIEGLEKTILFDSGNNGGALMKNYKAARKNPADVDLAVISHNHWDHTGGLPDFLDSRTGIDVYLPVSFPDDYKELIKSKGSTPVDIEGFQKICDHVWTTGEMGTQIIEQSLIIETRGGLIVLTGCAHPGIEHIVEKAIDEKGDNILLVIGGFHLMRTGTDAVEVIAKDFLNKNIKYASPTHCSGDGTIKVFSETFGDRYIKSGAGKVINTADL